MRSSLPFLLWILGAAAALSLAQDDPAVPIATTRTDPDPVFFEERIQPIFAANCGTSGCHGAPGAGRLLIERPNFQGRYSQAATQKNLETALSFVEFKKPMESRLLLKPLKVKDGGLPHTGQQYDFGKNSDTYKIFEDWIVGVELKDVAPIADAGPDRSGKRGEEITLDGTASRGPTAARRS